jgi:hypothetical protein
MSEIVAGESSDYTTLRPFQEIVGELTNIECSGGIVHVRLSTGTLRFEDSSTEAEICQQILSHREGERIGILRMDSVVTPLVIRVEE